MGRHGHPWTLANGLSAVRLACAPVCAWAIVSGHPLLAAGAFALAVATDFADGPIARRRNQATALGGYVDHGVDALFCTVALGALAVLGAVPAVLPVLVAAAFAQYVLDSRSATGRQLRGSRIGRYNGIAYYVLVGIPVVRDAAGLAWPPTTLVLGLGWLLVFTTAVSMLDRLRTGRRR